MKRTLTICFLVGLSFVFLAGNPGATAYAQQSCQGQCSGCACVYGGDVFCSSGQYTYPDPGCSDTCPPPPCTVGSGGWFAEVVNANGSCSPYPACLTCSLPTNQWWIASGCPGY
jgi:hypothetical protein